MSLLLDEDSLTVAEAARLLKVSPSTIWRWINQGQLPAYRVGQRRVRLNKAELARLITPAREQREESGAMDERERALLRPLMEEEQAQALQALADARRLRSEILARRGGIPFSSSDEILDQLRDARTRDLR